MLLSMLRLNTLRSATLVLGLSACTSEQVPTDPSAGAIETTLPDRNAPSRPRGVVEDVPTPGAWGVAVRDDGLAFFTQLPNGRVGITSTKTRAVDGFIPIAGLPTGIVFAPDGKRVYVAKQSGSVSVLDAASKTVVGTLAMEQPLALRVSPDGSRLFVSTGIGTVLVVDIATLRVVRTIDVGFASNGFAVHPDGRRLYVSGFVGISGFVDGKVSEIDMSTGDVLRTFTVGDTPQEMALDRKGARLYVANEGPLTGGAGYLTEITLLTGQLSPPIALQGGGFGVGITPDDAEAYVSIPGAGVVQIFKLQNRRLTKTLQVGGSPRRIAFSQRGSVGAVTNESGYISFVH
jgi:YVTN family beta-propeller protein